MVRILWEPHFSGNQCGDILCARAPSLSHRYTSSNGGQRTPAVASSSTRNVFIVLSSKNTRHTLRPASFRVAALRSANQRTSGQVGGGCSVRVDTTAAPRYITREPRHLTTQPGGVHRHTSRSTPRTW